MQKKILMKKMPKFSINKDGYSFIPKTSPHFEYYGLVFEAPKTKELLTDGYLWSVIRQIFTRILAEWYGNLAFLYYDTYGLRKETIFFVIENAINEWKQEEFNFLKEKLKNAYSILRG